MRPTDVRAEQLAMLSRLTSTDPAVSRVFEPIFDVSRAMASPTAGIDSPADLTEMIAGMIANSELWTLTPEILAVVEEAVETLPPHDAQPSDFPSEFGWLRLPHTLTFQSTDGVPLPADMVTWYNGASEADPTAENARGCMMMLWEAVDPGDYAGMPMVPRSVGPISYSAMPWVPRPLPSPLYPGPLPEFGATIPREFPDLERAFRRYVTHGGDLPIPDDATITQDEPYEKIFVMANGLRIWLRVDPAWRFLLSLFLLLQSELPQIEHAHAHDSRAMQKRMRYARVPKYPVTTVHWRKRESGYRGGEGHGTPLSYRHLRRGHWRQQWYPSEGRHRPRWIPTTIVGDASLPFRDRKVVNVVNR